MFYIGQKVVCIGKPLHPASLLHIIEQPVTGKIYTIRGILAEHKGDPAFGVGLLLEEILNPIYLFSGMEHSFYSSRFRPIQKKKTDISIFTKMLNKKQKELLA